MSDQDVKVQIKAEDLFTAVMLGMEKGMQNFQKSIEQLGPVAKKTGDAIDAAFNTLGMKPAAAIKAEQDKIVGAFNVIKNSGKASADEISAAQTAMQEKLKQLGPTGSKSLGDLLPPLRMIPFYFNQALQMVDTFAQGLMRLSGPAMQMQKLNAQFLAATGSSGQAAKDMNYIREVSAKMGLSFQDTAGAFAKFAASTRNTSIEGAKAKEVFEGVATASVALQLSTEETNGILLAFSQMIGKGRISAEELNQVAERLPGSLDIMAKSVGMTGMEFRRAATDGKIMAVDLMEKVGPALKSLYGEAALLASNGPIAQLNRLKTAVFELGAAIGSGPMAAVGMFAGALTTLAEAAKSAVKWLGADSPWAAGLRNIAAGIGVLSVGLASGAIIWGVYTAATSAAATVTWTFTAALLANPLTPIFLAIGAAAIGLAAGLAALSDLFFGNTGQVKLNSDELKKNSEEARKAAAERKQVEESYEKALGVSIDRQIKKRESQYDSDKELLNKKLSLDLKDIGDNEAAKTALLAQNEKDSLQLEENFYGDIAAIRNKDVDARKKAAEVGATAHVNMLKLLGKEEEANSLKIAEENNKRRSELDTYYQNRIDQAKAGGQVLVGIDREIEEAKATLEKQFMIEARDRGETAQKEATARAAAQTDSEIQGIRRKVNEGVIKSREGEDIITRLTVASARDQYEAKKQMFDRVAADYGKDSEKYKSALNDMETAHKAYIDANLAAYKKYSDEIKGIDQEIKNFRMSLDEKIKDNSQKLMTEDQKWLDNKKRAEEAFVKAKEAYAAKDFENAKKYTDEAVNLAMRLTDKRAKDTSSAAGQIKEIEDQLQKDILDIQSKRMEKFEIKANETRERQKAKDFIDKDQRIEGAKRESAEAQVMLDIDKKRADAAKKIADIRAEEAAKGAGVGTANAMLVELRDFGTTLREEQKKTAQDALAELKKIQDMKLDPKNLDVNLNESALSTVKQTIASLTATETKTIIIKTIQTDGTPSYKGYFAGGKVASGSPLRDSVNAVLARDEWVINNRATGFWGDDIMSAINAPLSAAGQRLNGAIRGQSMAAASEVQNMGTINLNIGGDSFPVRAPVDVLREFETAVRRKMMRRPQ